MFFIWFKLREESNSQNSVFRGNFISHIWNFSSVYAVSWNFQIYLLEDFSQIMYNDFARFSVLKIMYENYD